MRPVLALVLLSLCLSRQAVACADLAAADAAALTLAQALLRVDDCHPDVRAARATLGLAVADVQVAGQVPNPQFTLGAGSVGQALGPGPLWNKTFDHSLRLDQLIERGGKPGLRRAVAEAARAASLADLADTRRRAVVAVAQAHQDLWATQGRASQLAVAVTLSTESLRLLDQRVRAGDAPALDATRFRLDDARLRADWRQSQADLQGLQRQLALLIGAVGLSPSLQAQPVDLSASSPAIVALLAAAVAPPAGSPPAASPTDAAPQRADVAAAQARVAAAELARDLAAANRSRDVSVGLQLDRWPTSPGNSSGTGNTVSVTLSVPLFVRHAYEGESARAEADLLVAREALRRTQAAAAADMARSLALARAALDRRRLVQEQLVPAAEQVAAGAELAYRRGASSALELLDARRSLRAVHIERFTADAELAKALADWQAAATPFNSTLNP